VTLLPRQSAITSAVCAFLVQLIGGENTRESMPKTRKRHPPSLKAKVAADDFLFF
jgi:hypothetical protein